MKREQARVVFLVIAAWILGALLGSQIHRPQPPARSDAPATPYFKPGHYWIEAADGKTHLFLTFDSNWMVEPW